MRQRQLCTGLTADAVAHAQNREPIGAGEQPAQPMGIDLEVDSQINCH